MRRTSRQPYNLNIGSISFFWQTGSVRMDKQDVAREVLASVGGPQNVLTNTVCMTRLRITLANPRVVNYEELSNVHGVLGTAVRGYNGLEIVFGPRVIEDIYGAFIALTGKPAGSDALFPMTRRSTNMHVQIKTERPAEEPASSPSSPSFLDDDEMSKLEDMFGKRDVIEDVEEAPKAMQRWRLVVLNGPNLNMLGLGASGRDDTNDFSALLELCKQTAKEVGFERCDCFQSNHEGDLVDKIQDAFCLYEAIVINPGAYGSSAALRDALRAVPIPTMEVHLHVQGEPDAVGSACMGTISGLDTDGYRKAIITLAQHLNRA